VSAYNSVGDLENVALLLHGEPDTMDPEGFIDVAFNAAGSDVRLIVEGTYFDGFAYFSATDARALGAALIEAADVLDRR
jgi:hypothetical protein